MKVEKRKGARSKNDISKEIQQQLNLGEIESANLVEWLNVDQKILLKHLLTQVNRATYYEPILIRINRLRKPTVNSINEMIGAGLVEEATRQDDQELFTILSAHVADMPRCWASYMIGKDENININIALERIQPFVADHHFGVREISWMAVRPKISHNLDMSLQILFSWSMNPDENIRRFSTEAIRPRGVWCQHIDKLKENPELALPILQNLKSDKSKYVQDSVGNWLNDASKSKPEFVINLCKEWEKTSPTKETNYIIKKALRTIYK